jgi:hypothetical protein
VGKQYPYVMYDPDMAALIRQHVTNLPIGDWLVKSNPTVTLAAAFTQENAWKEARRFMPRVKPD